MKTPRQHDSSKEDGLTMSQRNTRLKKKTKTSTNRRTSVNSKQIPIDLIIEILLRLPPKSIARSRCVSKLWASTLRLPCFTELFLTRSLSRSKLFFSGQRPGSFLLFSAPQVQNLSLVTASDHKFPFVDGYYHSNHLRGLLCITKLRSLKERQQTDSVIYNPTTRESLNLPRVKMKANIFTSLFVYDPIDKQFKVLSMTWKYSGSHLVSEKHQVLTLGTKFRWRKIKCSVPYPDSGRGICIDGDFYYPSMANGGDAKIVSFDVRYEKFRFINCAEDMRLCSTLVNYKGKVGALTSDWLNNEDPSPYDVTRESRCFELWVLVDAEKHEWSKHVYVLPSFWRNVVASNDTLHFVGVIAGTDEIVLAPSYHKSDRFYVYYYNLEKETIRRVEIEGMDAVKDHGVHTFIDHLEDVKLLQTL